MALLLLHSKYAPKKGYLDIIRRKTMVNITKTMNILSQHEPHSGIETIEPMDDLTGINVLKLKEWLYACLYENRYLQLIDFSHVSNIDKQGIAVLYEMLERGMQIRLFNVSPEIKLAIRAKKYKSLLSKIYHETTRNSVVFMFKRELLDMPEKEKSAIKRSVKRRRYIRAKTSLPIEFKYRTSSNETILCKAQTRNISIGGMFADNVNAINRSIEKFIKRADIIGKELYGLRFELSPGGLCIETDGVSVRENRERDNFGIGIRFKDITQCHEEMLMGFVYDNSV